MKMKRLRKIISLTIAVLISLTFNTVSVFAEGSLLRVKNISSSASNIYMGGGVKATYLNKSCTIKKSTLSVKEDEMLFISSGITLCLYKGAAVDGMIYIEKGGKLLLSGGTVEVSDKGMILSDGTIKLKEKALIKVTGGGEVFVGSSGILNAPKSDSLDIDPFADFICIGKTNSKNDSIMQKPVAAYVYGENGLSVNEAPASLLPKYTDYMQSNAGSFGKKEQITFIFDNGHSIKVNKINNKISAIDGFPTDIAGQLNGKTNNNIEYYSRIYEINNCDYIYDMKGISDVLIDENNNMTDYDGVEYKPMITALKGASKDNYIGKLTYSGIGILPQNADMYLNSDGSILVMWKYDSSTESLPAKYLNEPQETLDKLYYAAMMIRIDQ